MGHKNPDTDAICSAIAYADLLRQTRIPEAEAACCGTPNSRTKWVLKQAGLPRPRLIADVRPRAIDVCQAEVATASFSDTIFQAYHRMADGAYRSLPVVDDDHRIIGLLSLLDLLPLCFDRVISGPNQDRRQPIRRGFCVPIVLRKVPRPGSQIEYGLESNAEHVGFDGRDRLARLGFPCRRNEHASTRCVPQTLPPRAIGERMERLDLSHQFLGDARVLYVQWLLESIEQSLELQVRFEFALQTR